MTEADFLAALHRSPNDPVAWLALADWLDENGQPERAELHRLVRRLCTSAAPAPVERPALEARLQQLMKSGVQPVTATLTTSVGITLALLPPGVFRMGSPDEEEERNRNETLHEVAISRAFYFSLTTVTQRQFQEVMGDHTSYFSASGGGHDSVKGQDTSDFPVDSLPWAKANEFCRRLTLSEAEHGSPLVFRLPSEAEWEYACRAGTTTRYNVGDTLSPAHANYRHGAGPNGHTTRVGSFPPNPFGLYDMHGNVSEWVADWYARTPKESVTDPTGPTRARERVVRNGSAGDAARTCRSAFRLGFSGATPNSYLGFRVAATAG